MNNNASKFQTRPSVNRSVAEIPKYRYNWNPYNIFDALSCKLWNTYYINIEGSENEEDVDKYGARLLVVNGKVQKLSVLDFLYELFNELGITLPYGFKSVCSFTAEHICTSQFGLLSVMKILDRYGISQSVEDTAKCERSIDYEDEEVNGFYSNE